MPNKKRLTHAPSSLSNSVIYKDPIVIYDLEAK